MKKMTGRSRSRRPTGREGRVRTWDIKAQGSRV
jgi:hypothetical protein